MKLLDLDLDKFLPDAPTSEPVPAPEMSAEYALKRSKFLTADGQNATPLEQEALLEGNDLLEVNFIDRCLLVRQCVCRIQLVRGGKYGWATGFLVAPGLLMTNHHVFEDQASVGSSRISFDYWADVASQRPAMTEDYELRPDIFFVTSKELDYTVVAVADISANGASIKDRRFVRLIAESGKVRQNEYVTIFQHPEGLPMQVALRENQVVRAAQNETYIWYKADTAHGSSGSAVFNNSLQVVALHSSGRIKRDENNRFLLRAGGTTDDLTGLSETDVVWEANVGYRISQITANLVEQTRAAWPARLPELEAALRGGDVMSTAIMAATNRPLNTGANALPLRETERADVPSPSEANKTGLPETPVRQAVALSAASLVIPLQLNISLTAGVVTDTAVAPAKRPNSITSSLEAESYTMRMPVIYDGLETRAGFNPRFLDDFQDVPRPRVTGLGAATLAPLLDGSGTELKYAHFSIWIHKERRLALYTAANVDWRNRKKTVDGKSTSRDSLAGWPGKNYPELWAPDPRLDERYQLPDRFYSEDNHAFDKGHIVRRDDVCWGTTFSDIQMANGDSFHVTNCSPQIKEFNQGSQGDENWGDLEAAIAKITKAEAQPACIFAGPVLKSDDPWFKGEDSAGTVRIRIPREYWKIVVVKGEHGFEAYSFLLKQDVAKITEHEFYVTDEWLAAYKPVSELQALMRGWLDLSELAACDRHPQA